MKLFIEKIDRSKTVQTQDGKILAKLGVFANSRWYGCFQNRWNNDWKEGDEIDVEVKEVKANNGKTFWNILPPHRNTPAMDELLETVRRIEEKLDKALSKGVSF